MKFSRTGVQLLRTNEAPRHFSISQLSLSPLVASLQLLNTLPCSESPFKVSVLLALFSWMQLSVKLNSTRSLLPSLPCEASATRLLEGFGGPTQIVLVPVRVLEALASGTSFQFQMRGSFLGFGFDLYKNEMPAMTIKDVFSEQILADKLSKLNSTQQCIETLSHWCIFHQSKAEVVVTTWIKQFQSTQLSQKIPLLYLANDILQNSKRKGNEFVTEFWKVLPEAIKNVAETGDERGKGVITRLVNIWDERKVFGSRTHNLKDVMLGGELPPPLELGKKRPRSVKIMKRDSRSIKTKLSIGGQAEKIVSAMHLVLSDHSSEDAEMSKCKSAVSHVRKIEQDVDSACRHVKDPRRKTLDGKLEEEENVLKQCLEKLKAFEANRVILVTQLREALQEQESELESVHTLIELAQAQSEAVSDMRKQLTDENYIAPLKETSDNVTANGGKVSKTPADMAAEVVDKLTASSSSQMIMSSVLSSFAAEAAKNAGLSSVPVHSTPNNSFPKADSKQIPASDPTFHMPPAPTPSTNPYQTVLVPQQTLQSQSPGAQSPYQLLPNVSHQNYPHPHPQPSGGMQNAYGFPALPPLPMGPPPLMPPLQQQLQMTQQQQQSLALVQQQSMMSLPQQPQPPPGFRPLQPPGMAYYSHPPQSH